MERSLTAAADDWRPDLRGEEGGSEEEARDDRREAVPARRAGGGGVDAEGELDGEEEDLPILGREPPDEDEDLEEDEEEDDDEGQANERRLTTDD